jgi:two-component system nitrogen regulation response regulator GlnG
LASEGIPVAQACTGTEGLELASRLNPAAVLLDMRLPDLSGEEVFHRLRAQRSSLPIIFLTGHGSVPGAVGSILAGAFDYLVKPFANGALIGAVRRAMAHRAAFDPARPGSLHEAVTQQMGHGPSIMRLVAQMEMVAGSDLSVLITGETGTGKEGVAQALHAHGPRASRPFVVLDCGAVSEALIDSEFFGHERGAFTGATERRRGRFEMAAAGATLFLDEVGNLSSTGQQALLRAVQERVIYRIGGTTPIPLDIRLIAATNAALNGSGAEQHFRSDLYYRLAEFEITVPPLRSRPEDIEFLAYRFLAQIDGGKDVGAKQFDAEALELLRGHNWPGNVRQLRNVVRHAGLLAARQVSAAHIRSCLPSVATIPAAMPAGTAASQPLRGQVRAEVRRIERDAILAALARSHGNKTAAARSLGIDYKRFREKLKAIVGGDSKEQAHAMP